eukprot:GDKH01027100.1.p1 GENE.GDKH01027100.1~~GDKH01027100.1.p1  ORF type:complete len:74 (+),score=6.98 GDKH01027100.1:2-223(+)
MGPTKAADRDKVVVFVIGGLGLSESRAAYEASKELMERERVEVIVGGTSMMVARQALNAILIGSGSSKDSLIV